MRNILQLPLIHRLFLALTLVLAALSIQTVGARASYWQAGLPPLGGTNGIRCGDGFGCALANQIAFYGNPDREVGCHYNFNIWGQVATANCCGQYAAFTYCGLSGLVCETGETQTGSGCKVPRKKDRSACYDPGDPISATSGVKYEVVTDFSTSGDNPLAFTRTYFSDAEYWGGPGAYQSRFGRGWHSNFDAWLTLTPTGYDPPSYVFAILPDGREISFQQTSGYNFVARDYNPLAPPWASWAIAPNVTETLTHVGSTWLLTLSDDTVYTFDTTGRLTSIQYRGGYTQTLTWDSNGNNTVVADNLGRSLTLTYGANGLLSQLTDPDNNIVSYTYKDNTSSAAVEQQYGVVLSTFPHKEYAIASVTYPGTGSPQVRYLYENTLFPYALTGVIDERGTRYQTLSYDTSGRVATAENAGGIGHYAFVYDDTNSKTTVTNPLSKDTVYHYNRNVPGIIRLTDIEGKVSTNCAASDTVFGYDSNGFVNQMTDGEGRITSIINNTRGLPTSVTRGYGTSSASTTTYTWHSTLNVPTQMVQPNLTTDLTWASGQLTQVTQTDTTTQIVPYSTNGQARTWKYTYTPTGGLLASVDGPPNGSGHTVSYTYTSTTGFVKTVTDEVGHVTTFTAWNGRGQPTSMTDQNSVVTNFTYDQRGRLKTVTADPTGAAAQTSFEYNGPGDITKITRPNGGYLRYTWDDARRLTRIQDNTGASIELDHNALGDITARRIKDPSSTLVLSQAATFDELGRLLKFIGSGSQTWTNAYDKTNNLVSVTDPRSKVYGQTFDSLGRLTRQTDEETNQVNLTLNGKDEVTAYSDPRSLNTTYVRDGFGEVIQRTSPDTGMTVYHYSAAGKVTQVTDGRGVVTNLTYDNAGRLLTKQYPAATAENITVTWDATASGNKGVGRITRIDDASGSVEYTYNVLGQVTQEKKTTSAVVYTVAYAYDLDGNVTQITYPSGRIVTYGRDSVGRISGVTTKKDSGSSPVTLAMSVTYEPFGPLTSLTYGNGLALTKTFTQDYRINALQVKDASTSTVVVNRSHAFGDQINLTGITDNLTSTRNESYIYTPTNRLQEGDGIWGAVTWGYDSVGNRSSEVLALGGSTTNTYNYPTSSNLLSRVAQGSTAVRTFTYDGAGNVTADNRSGTTYNYSYNKRGRLAELSIGSTVTADYSYDGLERLAIRTTQNMTPAGTTHYVYDLAGHLISEASGTGTTVTEYVWLDDVPLAIVANVDASTPHLYFVHADHLNRPIKMTDGTEAIVWDAVYKPFGEVQSISGTAANNLRFPGQYFLIEDGLHYNWHRHYDPTIGRYLQADPISRSNQSNGVQQIALGTQTPTTRLDLALGSIVENSDRTELPAFVDGPSLYAYAKSSPQSKVDPRGLQTSIAIQGGARGVASLCLRYPALCAGTAAVIQQAWNYCRRMLTSGDDGCKDEIREAREICTEAYANGWKSDHDVGPYRKDGGGPWTIQDCMRGLISERCGGNGVN
jgi:RHS repeat-associated protein